MRNNCLRIFNKPILYSWIIGVVCCVIISTIVYAMMPAKPGNSFQLAISGFLLPGFFLWVQMNGSLLFGSGFGKVGDFLIIALGSALAWSAFIPFITYGILWLRYRDKEPFLK